MPIKCHICGYRLELGDAKECLCPKCGTKHKLYEELQIRLEIEPAIIMTDEEMNAFVAEILRFVSSRLTIHGYKRKVSYIG